MKPRERVYEFLSFVPWVTPEIVGKHLRYEQWKEGQSAVKSKHKAYIWAYNILENLARSGHIISARTDRKIYIPKGSERRRGMSNFEHNQALMSVLINAYLKGYAVRYASKTGNADGMIENYALEIDRGNHSKEALIKQIMKYDGMGVDKILYVSFPRYAVSESEKNDNQQFEEMKKLRKQIASYDLPKRLTKKLRFTTYCKASSPSRDPLKDKIWQEIDGRITSVS